jgi:hypothetical protein
MYATCWPTAPLMRATTVWRLSTPATASTHACSFATLTAAADGSSSLPLQWSCSAAAGLCLRARRAAPVPGRRFS